MVTLSGLLSAELAATCNALGYYDGDKYHLEPHCKETVKDIIRYLRRDESTHDIRRYLGNAKLLQTDLLPMMQCHFEDKELFDILLRLIVNLTNPALLLYNEVIPTERNEHNIYLEIVSHLQNYKEAFCNQKLWVPINERLGKLLNKDPNDRDEDDDRTVERILILVRNVLHIPVDVESKWRPDNDASVHDQIIWAFHQSGLLDLLLYITSSSNESNFSLHLLEIICLLVREQPPALLAKTASQRSVEEKNRDDEELLKIRQSECVAKQQKVKKFLGTRHSNFGGTFVIKNMKSISDREMIYHKPIRDENDISLLDKDKKKTKVPKNRQQLKAESVERRSALSIRLILKQYCVELLNAAYNPLMKLVKDLLVRGKSQDNDESYYFIAIKFFMEFNRNYKFQVKLVSETMAVDTFHFVQKCLENWFEMMTTDKKRIPLWSSRTHLALKAYKELLQNLAMMDVSKDTGVRESSKVIKSNIFYVIEYREMLLTLTNTYEPTKYSRQYLKDLVETLHIFLKLLSAFTKNKKIVVQKQVRKKKSTKRNAKKTTLEEEKPEEIWTDLSERLSAVLLSPINVEVIPFDAASDVPMEEQKVEAVKKINFYLKTGKLEEAVSLMRSAREVWPENDTFGSTTFSSEDELSWFKELYLSELEINSKSLLQNGEESKIEENEEDEIDEEEEEVMEDYKSYAEHNFNVMDLIKRFASAKVVAICCSLLQTFNTNSDFTNHCIAKMLHRIAWDCQLPAMLFQASLFCRFQQILMTEDSKYKELEGLAIYIVRKFTQVAQSNRKVFMELLFFKTAKEAYEIECGYGSFVDQKSKQKATKVFWEEHEEEELKRLYEEFMEKKPSEDLVEWIMDNLINKERSKRGVIKKMKDLNLVVEKPRKLKKYTEEQENELCTLFEEFRETDDPVKTIMEKLSFPMSRSQIRNTLVRLKMVQDKSELRKKRKQKGRNKSGLAEDEYESEERSGSSSDSEMDDEPQPNRSVKEDPPVSLPISIIRLVEAKHTNSFLSDGLKWVKACMQECLEDLDDEPSEVPLLPLSANAILSIDHKLFQQFLKAIKVKPPQEQEVYWRFPEDWKDLDFLIRINLFEILLSHDEDELSSYSTELNVPIKKITGEYCDLEKLLDEDIANDITEEPKQNNSSRVALDSSPNSVHDFSKIIADHAREALSKELFNDEPVVENISPETSGNHNKKYRRNSRRFGYSDGDGSDVETKLVSSPKKSRSHPLQPNGEKCSRNDTSLSPPSENSRKSQKNNFSKRILNSDSSGDEADETASKSLAMSPPSEKNRKTKKNNFSKRVLKSDSSDGEADATAADSLALGSPPGKNRKTKKNNFSKRILKSDSSDGEEDATAADSLALGSPPEKHRKTKKNNFSKRILKSDSSDDEADEPASNSLALNIFNADEEISDKYEEDLSTNHIINSVNNSTIEGAINSKESNIDSKRLRSDSGEDNDKELSPKFKRKRRLIIESDEE